MLLRYRKKMVQDLDSTIDLTYRIKYLKIYKKIRIYFAKNLILNLRGKSKISKNVKYASY